MTRQSTSESSPTLASVWQLPVLVVSIALFAVGLYLARPGDPTPQYAEALDQVQRLIRAGQYPAAIESLAHRFGVPLPESGSFVWLSLPSTISGALLRRCGRPRHPLRSRLERSRALRGTVDGTRHGRANPRGD